MDPIEKVKAALSLISIPFPRRNFIHGVKTEKEDVQCVNRNDPFSFTAFVSRMLTYEAQHWSSAPEAAVCFAKQGFVCVADRVVQCCGCKEQITVSCSWGKREIKNIVSTSHKYPCKWKILSTPEEYFRFPVDHKYVIQKFREILGDLLDIGTRLPVFVPDKLKPCVRIPQDCINSVLASLGVPIGDVQTSAIVLGLCGWVKLSKSTFQCNFCQRTCATWNFFALEDNEWKVDFAETYVEKIDPDSMLKNKYSTNVENETQEIHLMQNKTAEMELKSNDYFDKQGRSPDTGIVKINEDFKKEANTEITDFSSPVPCVTESNSLDDEIECVSSRSYDNSSSSASGSSLCCLNPNDESKIPPGGISKHVAHASCQNACNDLETTYNSSSPSDEEDIHPKKHKFDLTDTSVENLNPQLTPCHSPLTQSPNSPETSNCDFISPCMPKETEDCENIMCDHNNLDLCSKRRIENHSPVEKMDFEFSNNIWKNPPKLQNNKYADDCSQENRDTIPTISSVVGEYTMHWVNNNEKNPSLQRQLLYFGTDSPSTSNKYEMKGNIYQDEINDFSEESSLSDSSLYSEKMCPNLKSHMLPFRSKQNVDSPYFNARKSKKRALLYFRKKSDDKLNSETVMKFLFRNRLQGEENNPIFISEDELSSEGNDDFSSHHNTEYEGAFYKNELEVLDNTLKQRSRESIPITNTGRVAHRRCSSSNSLQTFQCKYINNNKVQPDYVNEYHKESHKHPFWEGTNMGYGNECFPKTVMADFNDKVLKKTERIKQLHEPFNLESITSFNQKEALENVNVIDSDQKHNYNSFGKNELDNAETQGKVVNCFLSDIEVECSDKRKLSYCSEKTSQNYSHISKENMISSYSDKNTKEGEDLPKYLETPCMLPDKQAPTAERQEQNLKCSDHSSNSVTQNLHIIDLPPNNCRETEMEKDKPDISCTPSVSSTDINEISVSHIHQKVPHYSGEEGSSNITSEQQEEENPIPKGESTGPSIESRSKKRKLQDTDFADDDKALLKCVRRENKKVFFHPELEHRFWCVWRRKNRCPDKTAISRKCWEIFLEMITKNLELQEIEKNWNEFSDVLNCISSIWNL